MLNEKREVLLFDVRLPLDLLADSEIIPGAVRVPPKDILENPSLIPRDEDTVVYCTCPSDKTSRTISQRAHALNFLRVRFLKGGLAAWKQKGYPVEPYRDSFHLDTAR
jgi:rhodanese-related sulfurtransferase